MNIEKQRGKAQGASENLDRYLQKSGPTAGEKPEEQLDSLRLMLVQCVQVKDYQLLEKLMKNEDEATIANTVEMLASDKLQMLVEILVEKLNGETQNTKAIVLWLKLILKGNLQTIVTMPTVLDSLRGALALIKKKEEMLSTIRRMRGKIDVVLGLMQQKKAQVKEKNELKRLKPLLVFEGGKLEESRTQGASQQAFFEEEDGEDSNGLDDELDDELDEGLDEEDQDMMYQEAYENEELLDNELDSQDSDLGAQ